MTTDRHMQVAAELLEAAQKRAAQAEADRELLAVEVKAARMLGDSSPIAFEFCRQQWADARRATDAAKALQRAKEAK
jgi:hypothetical protein